MKKLFLLFLFFISNCYAVYPEKPITVVIPFGVGGNTDIAARVVISGLEKQLKQKIIIENVAGAGGVIGTRIVAKSAPDGYKLVYGSVGTHGINPYVFADVDIGYDPVKDFESIGMATASPNVILVHPGLGVKTLPELINLVKSEDLNYASNGIGTSQHMDMELLKTIYNFNITHIPYKSNGIAHADVAAGRVPIMVDGIGPALQLIDMGVIPVAVTSLTRSPRLPKVPAVSEYSPGFEMESWTAIWAPAKTPLEIIKKLNTALNRALRDPEVQHNLSNLGYRSTPGTTQDLDQKVRRELNRWDKWSKVSNYKKM
jgi:tripartite-type tricarboxylate transporter receptor subunit TctC